eukprot:GDKI01033614.1.p1 GENE.GDKI01033614.1~~GDKI01033614.1.p1  ORF type:complete len:255 (-),score=88.17 GDKI01033614.1:5-769(-)
MGCCTSSYQMLANELPAITVREMAQHKGQLVRLIGHVAHNGKLLTAPITGRQCVCYTVVVEEREERRHHSSAQHDSHTSVSHRQVASEQNMVDFLVAETEMNGTVHAAYIPNLPHMVKTLVHTDTTTRSGLLDNPNAKESAFLARHNVSSTGLFGMSNRDLRYEEAVFEPGELVAVMGMVAEVDTNKGKKLTIVPIDQTIAQQQYRENQNVLSALPEVEGKIIVSDQPSILKGATLTDNHQPQPLAAPTLSTLK